MKSISEIIEQKDKAKAWADACDTMQDPLKFEDGVYFALSWVLGTSNIKPIEADYKPDEAEERQVFVDNI
jgi:hypothetical protein